MSQEILSSPPVPQEPVATAIMNMLPQALTTAGITETNVPANLREAIVNIVRASIAASVPEMLALVPAGARQEEGATNPSVPAQSEQAAVDITVDDFYKAGMSALAAEGFNNSSPTTEAPVPKKFYWVEMFSVICVMLSGAIAGVAVAVPGRTNVSVRTAIIMFCLSIVLLFCWAGKVAIESIGDGAYVLWCHYNIRRNGKRVFYYKFWAHLFGSLLVVANSFLTVYTLISRLNARDVDPHGKDFEINQRVLRLLKYVTTLLCIVFTAMSAGFQSYRAKRKIDLVQTTIEAQALVRRLKPVEDMPPEGRADFYKFNRDIRPYKLPI